jgi:hypothetical protein
MAFWTALTSSPSLSSSIISSPLGMTSRAAKLQRDKIFSRTFSMISARCCASAALSAEESRRSASCFACRLLMLRQRDMMRRWGQRLSP